MRLHVGVDLLVERHLAKTISGLAAGLAHFEPLQRSAMLNVALGIAEQDCYALAIDVLGVGLSHLPHRSIPLLEAALNLPDEWDWIQAIAGWRAGIS